MELKILKKPEENCTKNIIFSTENKVYKWRSVDLIGSVDLGSMSDTHTKKKKKTHTFVKSISSSLRSESKVIDKYDVFLVSM